MKFLMFASIIVLSGCINRITEYDHTVIVEYASGQPISTIKTDTVDYRNTNPSPAQLSSLDVTRHYSHPVRVREINIASIISYDTIGWKLRTLFE